MIRRLFLKMVGSAAVAFAVGVEHFRPITQAFDIELEGRDINVDVENERYSPVIHALRGWNDGRLKAIDEAVAAGFTRNEALAFYHEDPQVKFTIKSNKLTSGAVRATDIYNREFHAKV